MDADAVNLGLLLLRVGAGLTLAAHGYAKVFQGGRLEGTARWFDSMGMRPGWIHARLAAATELGSGVLLALGLFTPLAAAGAVGVMFVAAWTVHKEHGFFIVRNGWEYNWIIALVFVAVGTIGAGEWSLDWALFDEPFVDGVPGLILGAGLGLAGGIAQLALFYRPPAKAEA